MGPCLAVVGNATKEVFEAYVEQILAPSLRPGQVVVMDNLAVHKGELVEERSCELVFLLPYSLDLNPIEEAFSKVKGFCASRGEDPRSPDRGDREGAGRGDIPGCLRLLRALRIPTSGCAPKIL
ncbi:hypothetical protein BH24ACT19_BH24ACT19_15550 [soil metagenome]